MVLGEDLLARYLEQMTFNEQKLIERGDEINVLYPNIQNLIYDMNNHYLCEFLPKNASAPWLRTKESILYGEYIIYIGCESTFEGLLKNGLSLTLTTIYNNYKYSHSRMLKHIPHSFAEKTLYYSPVINTSNLFIIIFI